VTDEDHANKIALQNKFEAKSDAWRAQSNQPLHNEDAKLNPADQELEMKQAKAEMRYLLAGKFDNADERMAAAAIATRGRPISSRILAEEMTKEAGSRKAAMYAAAAGLSGLGR
tara:strand:+ start:267 stop:608 length:342 start_codon:yes stop_codon:yes gene_type:complete